ncbi:response regulator transcription factor [Bermanella marisrubri]|uniref:Response regulator containing a CheY-like receiver domain and an HTH DNA-binding domain n=1 Tax=Bermanella marisrubri TaxID=207949 RepID=Q1MYT3_9GAMM|nr:response regulator transcription factor [Bermanella marisrubri]EAT11123.1 Response regulator containing a CheY-like receiver domain and an HTH DNA-binding domain [Oceanobacter sp. RED65] [Bermanella marisrubri]QIZ83450.1 response regulator transcription factor [Bermanella marisrubri]
MNKILIIDDHQVYLDGLELIVQSHLEETFVLKATDYQTAHEILLAHPDIDLTLIDLSLGESSGLEVWKELKHIHGPIPVAILSASEEDVDIARCKRLGALGFIKKSSDNAVLTHAISKMLDGEPYFPYDLSNIPNIELTPRQREVLQLLAQGLPNKAICRELNMSEATVKTHLRTIFALLNVNTRTQCVNVAQQYSLI